MVPFLRKPYLCHYYPRQNETIELHSIYYQHPHALLDYSTNGRIGIGMIKGLIPYIHV